MQLDEKWQEMYLLLFICFQGVLGTLTFNRTSALWTLGLWWLLFSRYSRKPTWDISHGFFVRRIIKAYFLHIFFSLRLKQNNFLSAGLQYADSTYTGTPDRNGLQVLLDQGKFMGVFSQQQTLHHVYKEGCPVDGLWAWMSAELVSSCLFPPWVNVLSRLPTPQTSNQLLYSHLSFLCDSVTTHLISPGYKSLLKPHKKRSPETPISWNVCPSVAAVPWL